MKYSWQRQIILETIQEHKEHLSAQQIYGYARERCPHISLGTVYRNLNLLADLGQIRRVPIPGQPDHFDSTLEQHAHFRCTQCGAVFDLPVASDFDPCTAADPCGCRLTGYELVFSGVCAECCAAEKKN